VWLGGANNVIIRPTHVRLPQLTDVGRTGGGGTHRNIVPRGRGSSEKRKWRCFFREDTGCYALRTVYTTSRRIKKHKRPTTCLGVGREIVTENKATISAVRPPPPTARPISGNYATSVLVGGRRSLGNGAFPKLYGETARSLRNALFLFRMERSIHRRHRLP